MFSVRSCYVLFIYLLRGGQVTTFQVGGVGHAVGYLFILSHNTIIPSE